MLHTPPYRIETERTVVRCYHPCDAKLCNRAIKNNLEHLRPWMPWALHEPESLADKTARLRTFRGQFDMDVDYVYGIFNADESEVIGGTGLHKRVGEGAFEIGYWICNSQINRGIATEIAAALTKVGFEKCNVNRIEVHCDPLNERSRRIPEKLGFKHEATLSQRGLNSDGKPRDEMIWTMFAERYSGSPAASATVKAFDCAGMEVNDHDHN